MNHFVANLLLSASAPARARRVSPLLGRLRRWREARDARRHLLCLSDHLLYDIGLERDQIDDALNGTPEASV
jgi:uncharacterized protein YjiS (DUF1127 family)